MNAGLKYNLYADPVAGILYSTGFTYEIPMGSTGNFQKYGNGQFHLFTTHGRRIGSNMHFMTAIGSRLPADDNLQNRMIYWSNHLDYRVTKKLYAFTELNWYNWASSGNGPLNGVEGGDLFSLGSSNVTGNDIVTEGVGFKYKRKANRELGFVYEFPLTERRDVLKDRGHRRLHPALLTRPAVSMQSTEQRSFFAPCFFVVSSLATQGCFV